MIGIHFGAFAPPLLRHLEGMRFSADEISCAQKDADAICRLRIRDFISTALANRAHKKIVQNLERAVRAREREGKNV
jgi:hypothetical protein